MKGLVLVMAVCFALILTIKGCVDITEAQTYDVRSTNDRTLQGNIPLRSDPMVDSRHNDLEASIDTSGEETVTAVNNLSRMMWDPSDYAACLDYNAKVYSAAMEVGDMGLALEPQFESLLRECWRMTP